MLQATNTGEVGESSGEEVMDARMGASLELGVSLSEGRVIAGRVETLLEDGAFLGEGELTVGVRASLGVVSEVSLGAPLGDGVEVSLEVSVAGAFLGDGTAVASFGAPVAGATGSHLINWAAEFSSGVVADGAFCSELIASREGFAGNSLGCDVLGAFLDGVLELLVGEGTIIAGAALGDRAAGSSLRATVTGAFLREEGFLTGGTPGVSRGSLGETTISCLSAGMVVLEVAVAEAFCEVGGFSSGAVVMPEDGAAVLGVFWEEGGLSSETAVTPLSEVSLGAAVWVSFLEDGVTIVSLRPAILGVFL